MATLQTKFNVGLFVIIGLVIAIVAITWLGMSHYFETGDRYVAYFDESVQGLDRDSPVKYRGVPVGRVEHIGVAPDSTLIEVIMKIDPTLEMKTYVDDVAAQLETVGITGIMYIGLDRKRNFDPERSPRITFKTEYPVIATVPSDIKKYMEGLEDVLTQLSAMDVEGLSERAKSVLDQLSQSIDDLRLKDISNDIRSSLARLETILDSDKWDNILKTVEGAGTSFQLFGENANKTVEDIHQMVAVLDRIVVENEAGVSEAILDFQQAMGKANAFMTDGSAFINNSSSAFQTVINQLLVIEQNLEAASDNLNQFIEIIADQPSQLIFGEPPPPRKIDR